MGRPKSSHPRARTTSVRLTDSEHQDMASSAAVAGFKTVSDYLRHLHERNTNTPVAVTKAPQDTVSQFPASLVRTYHRTKLGRILHGDCRGHLLGG